METLKNDRQLQSSNRHSTPRVSARKKMFSARNEKEGDNSIDNALTLINNQINETKPRRAFNEATKADRSYYDSCETLDTSERESSIENDNREETDGIHALSTTFDEDASAAGTTLHFEGCTSLSGIESERKPVLQTQPISTNLFYSGSKCFSDDLKNARVFVSPRTVKTSPRSRRHGKYDSTINKGVRHKIRRPLKPKEQSTSTRDIDLLLRSLRNDKLRKLITSQREEKAQIEKVENIFRNFQNPIEMARPLTALYENDYSNNNVENSLSEGEQTSLSKLSDFSDLESDGEQTCLDKDNASVFASTEEPLTPAVKRKFFKSGSATGTRKEIQITNHIKATVCNGKISLLEDKKPKRRLSTKSVGNDFSDEHASVLKILSTLNDASTDAVEVRDTRQIHDIESTSHNNVEPASNLQCSIDHEFRKRLPYNTKDPQLIDQQHMLLEFLLKNRICTEENFTIFIADPENHRQQAAQVVEQISSRNEEETADQQNHYKNKINENSQHSVRNYLGNSKRVHDVVTLVDNTANLMQSTEKLIRANPKKSFPIFETKNFQPLMQISTRRPQRIWSAGQGITQYQIDAGQKDFGAKQCTQCGLVYSAHECEEEKLHREYHASQHMLRFKSWLDEDIVAAYKEWGPDGRILRITDKDQLRRRERLMDVLKIVDKELGFSKHLIPKTYVGFIAIRKGLIVGLCLVQPLTKANKYKCIGGIDCYTEEEFEAKCGISRIWVSPFHRRMRIASKLIQAVRFNLTPGEEISLDKIAFSAPTASGILLAQKVTQMENFLVYQ